MNEDFVPFELAVKLKEKGYPQVKENTLAMYNEDREWFSLAKTLDDFEYSFEDFDDRDCVCPTISQVLKWLREEKKLHIEVMFIRPLHNRVKYYITDTDGSRGDFMDVSDEHYETWEQAMLSGIGYVLDNLI